MSYNLDEVSEFFENKKFDDFSVSQIIKEHNELLRSNNSISITTSSQKLIFVAKYAIVTENIQLQNNLKDLLDHTLEYVSISELRNEIYSLLVQIYDFEIRL